MEMGIVRDPDKCYDMVDRNGHVKFDLCLYQITAMTLCQ
jgi:hypothetical protein